MVVVNVNGGAHFTHIGLVSSNSQTSKSFTRFFHFPFSGAHDIISDLPTSTVQENLTMVLELVYSDHKRRVA